MVSIGVRSRSAVSAAEDVVDFRERDMQSDVGGSYWCAGCVCIPLDVADEMPVHDEGLTGEDLGELGK
jgi:hypothetical protein